MTILYKWKCPSCGSIQRRKEMPKACPDCGYVSSLVAKSEIQMPLIADPKNAVADKTYRQYEAASEASAVAAAEMAGVPVSEMSSLKVTNMETQLREGDLAVKPPNNPVSRFIDQNPNNYRDMQSQAIGFAAAAHTGTDAHAGLSAMSTLRQRHAESGARIVAAGQTRLKTENPSTGNMVTAAPSAEVLQRVQMRGGKPTF